MRKWGISTKDWFYGFRDDLRSRRDQVRSRLVGAAAEQWINVELFAFLSRHLSRGFYAYPEWKKRDVTVFRQHSNHADTDRHDTVEAIIETKVFYRGYGFAKTGAYVAKLGQQMRAARVIMTCAQNPSGPCMGLVFGAFVKWPTRFDRRKTPANASDFKRCAGATIREAARVAGLAVAKPAMETIIEVGEAQVGAVLVPEVGLFGQYLLLE